MLYMLKVIAGNASMRIGAFFMSPAPEIRRECSASESKMPVKKAVNLPLDGKPAMMSLIRKLRHQTFSCARSTFFRIYAPHPVKRLFNGS